MTPKTKETLTIQITNGRKSRFYENMVGRHFEAEKLNRHFFEVLSHSHPREIVDKDDCIVTAVNYTAERAGVPA